MILACLLRPSGQCIALLRAFPPHNHREMARETRRSLAFDGSGRKSEEASEERRRRQSVSDSLKAIVSQAIFVEIGDDRESCPELRLLLLNEMQIVTHCTQTHAHLYSLAIETPGCQLVAGGLSCAVNKAKLQDIDCMCCSWTTA